MRVQIVDPPAYTPPFDRSLCEAIARQGVEVDLVTSRFVHGTVPEARGYRVTERFYRRSANMPAGSRRRRIVGGLEHLRDMAGYGLRSSRADLVHFQWLTEPLLDSFLLPRGVPLVQTPHGLLRADALQGLRGRSTRRLLRRMDRLVALSEYGANVLELAAGVPGDRIRVIPHGVLDYLTRLDREDPLPAELAADGDGPEGPVVLMFGLMRPYKAPQDLIDAYVRAAPEAGELWIVGKPMGVDLDAMRETARKSARPVRFVPRFVADSEIPAIFRRADLVVLPYHDAEQSGVLYTALAFGNAILLTDVGGFGEVAATGAARLVPPAKPAELADALGELLADGETRDELGRRAREVAAGPYSWDEIGRQTVELYRELVGGPDGNRR